MTEIRWKILNGNKWVDGGQIFLYSKRVSQKQALKEILESYATAGEAATESEIGCITLTKR